MDHIKRIGGIALEVALGVFLLGMLMTAWGAKESKAATPARSAASAMLPQGGTICIVDDSNGNQLMFDRMTGAYTFTDCLAFTLTGTGTVTVKGCTITFKHVALDRRVIAKVDTCQRRATASAETYNPSRIETIVDRNTADDVCGCGDSMMGVRVKEKPRKYARGRR